MIELDFEEYQDHATTTAQYPGQGEFLGLCYAGLGTAGEAGEVADQIKKAWRNDGEMTPERREKCLDEVGDTLFYLAQVCTELQASMGEVAKRNMEKREERYAAGDIKGR